MVLDQIIIWTIVGSVLGLAGGVALLIKQKTTLKYSNFFVSFAAGAMLGVVFFDFLPETLRSIEASATLTAESVYIWSLAGILLFFVVERLFAWHHHHPGHEKHAYTYNLMFGDTIHNFLDGIFIAAVFLTEPALGPLAAIAVFIHEIPQEMADFGALLHGGWSRRKIIGWNLFSAFVAITGAVGTFFLAPLLEIEIQLVALTIGAFLYIAVVDLIPISFKKKRHTIANIILLLLGAAVIWAAGIALPGIRV